MHAELDSNQKHMVWYGMVWYGMAWCAGPCVDLSHRRQHGIRDTYVPLAHSVQNASSVVLSVLLPAVNFSPGLQDACSVFAVQVVPLRYSPSAQAGVVVVVVVVTVTCPHTHTHTHTAVRSNVAT